MASKSYVGVAPLTMARTEAGGYINIYAGDPVPAGVQAADLKRLVDDGFLGEVEEAAPASDSTPAPDSVEGILAEVGDDKAKAAAALATEKAKDKPRSTLVSKLEAVVGSGA